MAKKSLPPGLPYREWLIEHLKNRKNAAAYLEAAIQEDDTAALMQALRNIADAHGGIGIIAQETGLRRETLPCRRRATRNSKACRQYLQRWG